MVFWSLTGLTPYESARELQLKLVDLRAADRIEDTVLFLEHEPVITRGRGLQFTGTPRPRHMPLPGPLPSGVAFAESERGGDLTYHGPGQLVIYPIFKLDGQGFGPNHDVAGFLRRFEQVFIDVIGELSNGSARAESREHATGGWVGERKVASMGIAIRKWVTYHGLAINCVNDLKPFHLISPCGFSPEVMTRLSDLMELGDWAEKGRACLETAIMEKLAPPGKASHILKLSYADALGRLENEFPAEAAAAQG
jgi:lipoyl(octanoyl) transferase